MVKSKCCQHDEEELIKSPTKECCDCCKRRLQAYQDIVQTYIDYSNATISSCNRYVPSHDIHNYALEVIKTVKSSCPDK